jgi:PhnB protein
MDFSVFLHFDGECRAAIEHYVKIFKLEQPKELVTYAQYPEHNVNEADKDRILFASLPIFGCNVMSSDIPPGTPHVKGTNISLTLSFKCKEEQERVFTELSEGGKVIMPLQKTFWSELYGMVMDKFSIIWHLSFQVCTPP